VLHLALSLLQVASLPVGLPGELLALPSHRVQVQPEADLVEQLLVLAEARLLVERLQPAHPLVGLPRPEDHLEVPHLLPYPASGPAGQEPGELAVLGPGRSDSSVPVDRP